jgi:hypothetical protein
LEIIASLDAGLMFFETSSTAFSNLKTGNPCEIETPQGTNGLQKSRLQVLA